VLVALCLTVPRATHGQQRDTTKREKARDTTLASQLTAGEADAERPPRSLISKLQLDLGFTTMYLGGGLLFDVAAFSQDSASREQFDLVSIGKLRDARILTGGKFATKRPFTWQIGVMYDAVTDKWLFRQTGLMLAVPELYSWFFLGRAKEGFSLNKVMVGYDGWSMERQPFTDATVPLLADGFKWLGYIPSKQLFWNFGAFMDAFSEAQTFSTYNNQLVLRAGWIRLTSDTSGTLMHAAMNFRAGDIDNDTLQLRSRPEAFIAPYFIDTGKFPATSAFALGPELYYRAGNVLIGTEFYWQRVHSTENGDLWFRGGEASISWLTTGETRAYNPAGNYFKEIVPAITVIQGGPGAWGVLLKYSFATLNDGPIQGGVFWRITPMLNWYLTDNIRLEFAYGWGVLDRFGVRGTTQFFQSRIQLRL